MGLPLFHPHIQVVYEFEGVTSQIILKQVALRQYFVAKGFIAVPQYFRMKKLAPIFLIIAVGELTSLELHVDSAENIEGRVV